MLDLAPITRHLRAKASSHLLVAAVHHLDLFEVLSGTRRPMSEIKKITGLADRPLMVLLPALCAMQLLQRDEAGNYTLSELGRFLTQNTYGSLVGYTALEKNDAGVLQMRDWLLNDGPAETSTGLSYVMEGDVPSPMDEPESARFFTMALAGRARYLSPLVASAMPEREAHLLDVAGGTGYYTFEWLRLNITSTATILDRPEVLAVARGFLEDWITIYPEHSDVASRITWLAADMLSDDFPPADIILTASMFHDWPIATCRELTYKIFGALQKGGELWVHDAFLNDELDGPLAITDYSAMLFLGTKGRAYSRAEMRGWFTDAGLINREESIPTLLDYSLISAVKQ
jgi:hypothetical protein